MARWAVRVVARLLLAPARTALGGRLLQAVLLRAPAVVPVERLYADEHVVAFRHPRPSYPVHVVIVPRRPVADLLTLGDAAPETLAAVSVAVRHLVGTLAIDDGWRLITNGGRYQQVRQLHFHLVAGR